MNREEAFQLLANGALEEAYLAFNSLKHEYPSDWKIYDALAYLEANLQNNLEEALTAIEKARALGCPQGRYHRIRADIFWTCGQLNEAVSEFEQAVTVDRSLENLTAFANSLMKTNYSRAVPVWEEIVRKDPSNTTAYLGLAWIAGQREDWSRVLEMAAAAKELEPDNPKVLFDVGRARQGLAQYERAVDCYLQADDLGFRDKLFFHMNVASCYLKLDKYAKALEHTYEAQKLNPEDSRVDALLKTCREYLLWLRGEQRNSEAYPMMVIALQIWPNDGTLLAYMANLEIVLKQNVESGKEYMEKAFACTNADLDLLYEIKGCLWYSFLNKKEEGLACLEQAVSLNRCNRNLEALAFRVMDVDTDKARKLFDEVLSSDPKAINSIYGLAEISYREGRYAEGLAISERGYAEDPSHAGINALLGYGHFEIGELSDSLRFYLKAEELGFPDKAYIYTSIAQCYLKLGKREEARKYAQKATTINPDVPEAKQLLSDLG